MCIILKLIRCYLFLPSMIPIVIRRNSTAMPGDRGGSLRGLGGATVLGGKRSYSEEKHHSLGHFPGGEVWTNFKSFEGTLYLHKCPTYALGYEGHDQKY